MADNITTPQPNGAENPLSGQPNGTQDPLRAPAAQVLAEVFAPNGKIRVELLPETNTQPTQSTAPDLSALLENGKIRKELLPEGGQSEIASFPKSPYTPTVYTLCKIINEGAIPSEPFFVFAANDEKEEAGALEIKEQFIPIPVDTLSFKDDFRVKQYVAKNPHYAFKSLSSGKSYLIVDVPKQEGSKKFFYTLESSYNPLLPSVSKYIMPERDGHPEIEDHDGSVETGKASMNFKDFYNDPAETIKSVVHSYIFEEGVEDVFNSFFVTKLREFLEQEGYRKS